MHEESLVRSLLEQVSQIAAEHGGRAQEVRISIGPLSGAEPLLISSAFERLANSLPNPGLRLTIDQVPLEVDCLACGSRYEPINFCFRCPICGSKKTSVFRGDAVILESVDLALDDHGDAA